MSFSTDIVIGLEVHVELRTKTKLFCGCSRTGSVEPNTRTCAVCLGHPGSKPVLNRVAVDYGMKLAMALGCTIAPELVFSRKSYFYPDMSKNYQISQYELPLASGGTLVLSSGKEVTLVRIHLEEDPAALIHPSGMASSAFVLVDYNRSGNPLCEVVTEPEMQSPGEARDFMKQLISILSYLGIFDDSCILKADANISVRESQYTRVEIKNISGFREIERALRYEVMRQKKEIKEGHRIIQETRGWDALQGVTKSMRTKETEDDYGYIIDPDLVVTTLTDTWCERIRISLPELAREKSLRFVKNYGISASDASVLSAQIELAALYEKVAAKVDPILAAKWLRRELARVMNFNDLDFAGLALDENHLIELLTLIDQGEITETVGQKILEKLVVEPFDIAAFIDQEGLRKVSDNSALTTLCDEVIAGNEKVVNDFLAGNEKSLNFLIGQVMRLSKGTAAVQKVREILVAKLKP
jgi:aspartyl-tRNA(Asn)/glutamyl-tRNA(Gln) amidotransferase subunit B